MFAFFLRVKAAKQQQQRRNIQLQEEEKHINISVVYRDVKQHHYILANGEAAAISRRLDESVEKNINLHIF